MANHSVPATKINKQLTVNGAIDNGLGNSEECQQHEAATVETILVECSANDGNKDEQLEDAYPPPKGKLQLRVEGVGAGTTLGVQITICVFSR